MHARIRNAAAVLLTLAALALTVELAARVTVPKRYDCGANWQAFLQEPDNSMDVLFFGSSASYCNVIPAVIWQESGLSAYVMAGPSQTTDTTYFYVEEAFRRQSPSLIMVDATSVAYAADSGRDTVMVNLVYMPRDLTRLRATLTAAPRSQWAGLFFPLYAYHVRAAKLTADDFRLGLFGYDADPLAGYNYIADVNPVVESGHGFKQTEEDYANNVKWLQKISALAKEHNCRCVFYLSPNCATFHEHYMQKLENDLTADGWGEFVDFKPEREALGIDPQTDFRDYLHFNIHGAEKFSRRLAAWLPEQGLVPGAPGAGRVDWAQKVAAYQALS